MEKYSQNVGCPFRISQHAMAPDLWPTTTVDESTHSNARSALACSAMSRTSRKFGLLESLGLYVARHPLDSQYTKGPVHQQLVGILSCHGLTWLPQMRICGHGKNNGPIPLALPHQMATLVWQVHSCLLFLHQKHEMHNF